MESQYCNDTAFGPAVSSSGCRGGFDFTVAFEEIILSILPSAVFLILASIKAARFLRNRKLVVQPSALFIVKLISIVVFCALQLALVILWATTSHEAREVTIASYAVGFSAAIGLAFFSSLEHRNSPRPSFIIVSYLLISLVFDIARVRTAWLLNGSETIAATATAAISTKVLIVVVEAFNKRSILLEAYSKLSKEATSGIVSRAMFWWLVSLLKDGSKSVLTLDDLLPVHEKLDPEKLTREFSKTWDKGNHVRKHALAFASLRAWPTEVLSILATSFAVVGFALLQPFVIQSVVNNLLGEYTQQTRTEGFALVGAVALVYAGATVMEGFSQHLSFRFMAMVRGGLIGMIYGKLAASPTATKDASDSKVMTLIGTDIERICQTWFFAIASLVPCVVQLGLAVWLLERQLGVVCIAPVILVLLSTAATFRTAAFIGARQKTWLQAVQTRVNYTTKVMGDLKSVKMLGLSDELERSIQEKRGVELDLSKKYRRLASFNICLTNFPSSFTPLFTFMAYVLVAKARGDDSFTLSKAITSLSILTVLNTPLSQLLFIVPQITAALGCFERIRTLLNSDSWDDFRKTLPKEQSEASSVILDEKPRGDMADAATDAIVVKHATLGWKQDEPVIHDLTFKAGKDEALIVVLGPVGCGKSTLLQGLLGEIALISGNVWTATKRIAFCGQTPWISSGTVKQCIIGQSQVDKPWYDTVVHSCALDADLENLSNGDDTVVGGQGATLSGGQKQRLAIARALYARENIALFDDVLSGLDAVTKELVVVRVFGRDGLLRKMGATTILATHFVDIVNVADQVIILDAEGHVVSQGPPAAVSDDVVQSLSTEEQPNALKDTQVSSAAADAFILRAAQARQVGDFAVYKYYFQSFGWLSASIFVGSVICNGVFTTLQSVWLKWWSEDESKSSDGYWLGIYALFCMLKVASLVTAVYYLYVIVVPKSSKRLHQAVLTAAFGAPMTFLSTIETGTLVNRFSQDMQLVDGPLPGAFVSTTFQTIGCLSSAVLTIIATPYFAAVLPPMIAVLYGLQRFYLRTSRQLRLLELEAKAPLFSHIIDTINGLASIRAYNWSNSYTNKTYRLLGDCQKPYYLLQCIQQWLAVVLGLIVAGLATLLTALAFTLRGSHISAGFAGLALVNMMSLSSSLAGLIIAWTTLETSLGAISRVKTFSEDTPKEPNPDSKAPAEWPSQGSVTFESWTAGYSDFTVLHGISLSIQPGQKVAVCGRTGSGKSSLVTSILGMVDGKDGRVIVDNIDLATLSRNAVREQITCVTQDPFIFGGTIRENLDPSSKCSDGAIKTALQRVELWNTACQKAGLTDEDLKDVLDLTSERLALSHGQAQLFALARALLKKRHIVLLDEPTSSVDHETEKQIQNIISTEFKHATVIMITHRLSAIHSFDKVVVLDHGVLVEYGAPAVLLANPSGALSKLYDSQKEK